MIKLETLSFAYRKGVVTLKDVTTSFPPGIHLLLGENGAGKTTLLEVMAGLLRPQYGECLIDGIDVATHRPEVMRDVFFLGDNMTFPAKNMAEMVKCHAFLYPRFNGELLKSNLKAFGIDEWQPFMKMSLGTRRKAQLAYALSLGTEVLLLDEPANGLDIKAKQTLGNIMASSIDMDQTVIVSTHTVQDLENLFDGVAMLSMVRCCLIRPWIVWHRASLSLPRCNLCPEHSTARCVLAFIVLSLRCLANMPMPTVSRTLIYSTMQFSVLLVNE